MVFSSLIFLFRFLPLVLLAYFLAPRKWRNLVLLITSLFFYAWGEPAFVLLMILSIVINYGAGLLVSKFKKEGRERGAKWALVASVIVDLSLLGFFKYTGFLLENVSAIVKTDLVLEVILPIGISFYTFQMMSYVIDVYRGDTEVQKNIISFGAYVSLFPQLIAGPIVQYKTVARELDERRETPDLFASGVKRFSEGLFKKVFFANGVGALWESVSALDFETLPALTAWLGIIAFTLQIYFDFSGYSDMAIGIGRMLGFHFLENFDYPYISRSITEFWRRWHISLGSWFRSYVYIPLGGNRRGFLAQTRNLLIVWLLTGIWHGASWNFVLWGAYFGVILFLEKLFILKLLSKLPRVFSHIWTIFLYVYGWVIFAITDTSKIALFTKALFFSNKAFDREGLFLLTTYLPLILLAILFATPLFKNVYKRLEEKTPRVSFLLTLVAIVFILTVSLSYITASSYNPFLYFRF